MASTPGFEAEPHWWEANALTTAPSLSPPSLEENKCHKNSTTVTATTTPDEDQVGPDEDGDGTEGDANSRTISPTEDLGKKEAVVTLSNNLKNGDQENGYEMTLVHRVPNGQTQQENYNGFKYNFGEL